LSQKYLLANVQKRKCHEIKSVLTPLESIYEKTFPCPNVGSGNKGYGAGITLPEAQAICGAA
jgi:hypothetical protein